jgi:arylsulfatase A-like enzyme
MHLPKPVSVSLMALCSALVSCGTGRAEPEPAPPGPNILLVSLDTCRHDHTGLGGYERDTTPNLDRLAALGASFDHAYAQANETLYSHAAIFTADYPGDLAPIDDDFHLPKDARTLAEVLGLYGYDTAGFTGGAYLTRALGLGRGFELYRDELHFGSLHNSVRLASSWLGQPREAPFFLFVHGYDCHSPYIKPLFFDHLFDPDYRGIADDIVPQRTGVERIHQRRYFHQLQPSFVQGAKGRHYVSDDFFLEALPRAAAEGEPSIPLEERDLAHLVAHYDGSLAYADMQLGLLLARLEELDLSEETVVLVFSDHGEGLTDYGHFQHRPHLREHVIQVPLVVHAPGRGFPAGRRVDQFVRAIDIAPTILELAGVPGLQAVPGRSLVPLLEQGGTLPVEPVFAESRHEVTLRVPGEQLVLRRDQLSPEGAASGEPAAYYRFEGELGPGIPHLGPRALELRLRAWYEGLEADAQGPSPMDEELRALLRERGYW